MKITEKIKMVVMGLAAVTTLGVATLVAHCVGAFDGNSNTQSTAGKYVGGEAQKKATGDDRDRAFL